MNSNRTIRRLLRLSLQPRLPANRVSPQPSCLSPSLRHSDITVVDSQGLMPHSEKQEMMLQEKHGSALPAPRIRSLGPVTASPLVDIKARPPQDSDDISSGFPSESGSMETITWPKVAEALDRSLFVCFSFLVFFITVFMLPYMVLRA